jgi:hypothetical protein
MESSVLDKEEVKDTSKEKKIGHIGKPDFMARIGETRITLCGLKRKVKGFGLPPGEICETCLMKYNSSIGKS